MESVQRGLPLLRRRRAIRSGPIVPRPRALGVVGVANEVQNVELGQPQVLQRVTRYTPHGKWRT